MRVRWRGLELPAKVVPDRQTLSNTYGRFIAEPFERGFGTTVGNSLRRILLSSLEGSALTSMRVEGVDHEFTTIPGVLEDVTEIKLNVKGIVVKKHVEGPKTIRIEATGPGPVTAGRITADPTVEIVNKDRHVATLNDGVRLAMEFEVKRGRGYVTAAEQAEGDQVVGVIPLDAVFSPVTKANFRTEDTRVGQRTNYDRLILEIWTNGTVTPEMALVEAAKILRKHLNPFVEYAELGLGVPAETVLGPAALRPDERQELAQKLQMSIRELELSVRANNCLDVAGITTVGDLARRTEAQLLEIRNFGKTSLKEIKKKLDEIGVSLGIDVDAILGVEQT
jgi:DNA-directed RNA polymerase subunit alpha